MAQALPIAALAITAIGTGVAVAGQLSQAASQRRQFEFNAKVAENNATAVSQAAAFNADRKREQVRRTIGSQKAAFGAAGVDLSGSAQDLIEESIETGELDALTILHSGKLESNRFLSEASLNRSAGKDAERAGTIGAIGTFLTGASSVAGGSASLFPNVGAPGSSPSNPGIVGVGTTRAPAFRVNPSLNPAP